MFIVYHLYGKNSEPHSLTDYAKRVTQKILSRADTFASIIICTYSHFYTATQELLYCDRPQWPQDICLRHYNSHEVLAESRPISSFSFRPPLFFHLWLLYTMLSQWIKMKKSSIALLMQLCLLTDLLKLTTYLTMYKTQHHHTIDFILGRSLLYFLMDVYTASEIQTLYSWNTSSLMLLLHFWFNNPLCPTLTCNCKRTWFPKFIIHSKPHKAGMFFFPPLNVNCSSDTSENAFCGKIFISVKDTLK